MTSGWIILVRSKPDSDTMGVLVIPPGTKTLTVTPVPSRSFAMIALSTSSAAYGGPVGRGACIQHRAEAGRDVDDPAPAFPHHLGNDGVRHGQRRRGVDGNEAAPLMWRDLPELEGALPAIRSDGARADPGVVHEDIDAAEPGACGFGNLVGRGGTGQVRLDGEQFGGFPFARGRGQRFQGLSVAIDTGDPVARRQRVARHRPANATRR